MKSSSVNVDDVIVFEDAAIDLKILWDFTPLEVYADVDEDRITFLKTIRYSAELHVRLKGVS